MELIDRLLTLGHPYRRSSRRRIYEEIAAEFDELPDRIYRLAHHPWQATIYDGALMAELYARGIIV